MNNKKDLTVKEAFALAIQNHQNNNLQDAQNLYNKILEIDPNHSQTLNNLGAIFKELKAYKKAKSCYEKAIEINPKYLDAQYNLGIVFQGLGDRQKAKDFYEKAIEINPKYVNAHNNLGNLFKELGEYQKAKSCYEKAIELDPLRKQYMVAYGIILLFLGDILKGYEYIAKGEGVIKFTPSYYKVI